MTLVITDEAMTSDLTTHTARCQTRGPAGPARWVVSWLPDRHLDRNQAITAMTLAETVVEAIAEETPFNGLLIEGLASELDMTASEAIRRVMT